MKKFILHVLIFLLPIFIVVMYLYGRFYYVGYTSGELKDIDGIIEQQRNDQDILIGLGYNEQTSYYKKENANYYNAPLIALGTSRVMQFKSMFFIDDVFYNCGGAVNGNYLEYKNFLENLSYKPQMIVLGIDAWVFNDNWNNKIQTFDSFQTIEKIERDDLAIVKAIKEDYDNNKWKFDDLDNYNNNVGFNGRIKDSGFMYDGSYYYGSVYRNPELEEDYMFSDTFTRIKKGERRFEWGEHIDKDTIIQLNDLLSYCKNNNIEVVGIIVPFAPSVYKEMISSGNYGYLNEIDFACNKLFMDYDYEYYNYIDVSAMNVSDDYFVDGFHGSEVLYANIIKDIITKGSSVNKYVNVIELDNILKNAYSKMILKPLDD